MCQGGNWIRAVLCQYEFVMSVRGTGYRDVSSKSVYIFFIKNRLVLTMEWIIAANTSVYKSEVIIHAVYHNNDYGQSQDGVFL